MKDIDTSGWEPVGETVNTRYYRVDPEILACVPHMGSRDEQESARQNARFQLDYWKAAGHAGVVVVFFDNMVSQDKDARRVYQTEIDPAFVVGTALVGGSMLARAMGAFFLGLSKPRIPLKMFGSLADAKIWARELVRRATTENQP